MKLIYFLIGIVVLGGLIFYLISCKTKQSGKQTESYSSRERDTVKVRTQPENPYEDLRNMALDVTPEQLALSIPADETKVFGVVMDWDLGNGIVSVVSYGTGDASMYLSSGGGVIGGVQHEKVNKASREFVSLAQNHLEKSSKIDSFPLPDENCVNFYLLTNKGKFFARETMTNIENNSSAWLDLFEQGNEVISELRRTTENK